MTLALTDKPDGWLYDEEGTRIRRWFTRVGGLRVWPHKLQDLHALEKKRWEGMMKLREWCDTQEEPMQDKLNALTGPLVGDCPDEAGLKIILMRGGYTNPESRGRWDWYREGDHPPLGECRDGQELVNEWWYVLQRRRTIERMAYAYHTVFTEVLTRRHWITLRKETKTGLPLWKAARMTINGREYIFRALREYEIEFIVLPEDLNVLVIPEVAI